jgi:hopene-associated glycosyltransferase HpnB
MEIALIVLGGVALAAWAWLAVGHGWFWSVRASLPPLELAPASHTRVIAVVPARDEAETIGRAIDSLLVQQGCDLQVILVDDGSTDGTAQFARDAALAAGRAAQLTVLTGKPLAAGWTGKLWAVQQGIETASTTRPEWLLLADADVAQGPNTVSGLLALAEAGRYDLASYMVRLNCESAAEKLLIPAFVFFFFKLYPPRWTRDRRLSTAGAAGGCLLVRRAALENGGGIAAIRSAIIDDCALARLIKKNGGRVWLGLGSESLSLRRYPRFADVEAMIARTAFYQLNHSALLLAGTTIGMAVLYLAPLVLFLSAPRIPALLGAGAWALLTLLYLPMVRYYRLRSWRALTLPLAALFYLSATIHSAIKYWAGSGGEWKGRRQDHVPGAPAVSSQKEPLA